MDLLVNDLSVDRQFHNIALFHEALSRLMKMRSTARCHGRELYCNRGFQHTVPVPNVPMQQAITQLSQERQRAVWSWVSRGGGPFWDDMRKHDSDDYLECKREVVTDTAVGEAAFKSLHGKDCGLISLSPSEWEFSPVEVIWRRQAEDLDDATAKLKNWWDDETLNRDLKGIVPPITSWEKLHKAAASRFGNLIFSEDCFSQLDGTPFAKTSSDRLTVLFGILDQLAGAFDANGNRTAEGHEIYREHFTGDRAWFSDSSDSEKNDFRQKLTFKDPDNPGSSLLYPWHGKVSHSTFRLHFSWPIVAGKPVHIVYVGPKITKR